MVKHISKFFYNYIIRKASYIRQCNCFVIKYLYNWTLKITVNSISKFSMIIYDAFKYTMKSDLINIFIHNQYLLLF